MDRLKVASLFCGCGGTDVGFTGDFKFLGEDYYDLGMDIVYANDIEPSACEIFEKNFNFYPDCRDVRTIKTDEIPEMDVLTGGFPCQSFSIVAQNPPRLGIKSELGQLFFEMCRILKDKQPLCFVAENVPGLLSANDGQAFPLILEEYEKCGYKVNYKILNAADFGVPQNRHRVIIIGYRNDLKIEFDFNNLIPENKNATLAAAIDNKVDEKYYFSSKAVDGMMRNRKAMNKGRAQDLTKPCNTVGAHLAKVSLNSTDPVLFENNRYRRFTPREVARIQSFPDTFILTGSEGKQYRALGNAIPPVMIWYVAKRIKEQLDTIASTK